MQEIIVKKNSKINTIEKALEIAYKNDIKKIKICNGVYHEKIILKLNDIELIGENKAQVIITNDDYAKKIHSDGRDYNTFRTATLLVLGNNCTLKNLTILNPSESQTCSQAISLEVMGNKFKAQNCSFTSEQDTLLIGPLPDDLKERYTNFLSKEELFIEGSIYAKFTDCTIQGNIDYIFGTGSCLFANCELVSSGKGYVIAPAHSLFQQDGFNFINCHFFQVNLEPESVYIARPWRTFGKVNIINCTFDKHIKKEGYTSWNNKYPNVYNRIYEYPLLNSRVDWVKTYTAKEIEYLISEIQEKFSF